MPPIPESGATLGLCEPTSKCGRVESLHAEVKAQPNHITDEMYGHAAEFADDFRVNFAILQSDAAETDDEFLGCLENWCVVLGVLAVDTFESVVELLHANKLRAAAMLTRALIDYSVRLRYYILQAEKYRAVLKRRPTIPHEHIGRKIEAWRDWNNADAKMKGILEHYPRYAIPAEVAAQLQQEQQVREIRHQQDFWKMLKYAAPSLAVSLTAEDYLGLTRAVWLTSSAYLHGDQAVITDVVRYPDPTIHLLSPAVLPRTALAQAVTQMQEIMTSFGLVRGWNYGGQQWRWKWAHILHFGTPYKPYWTVQ